MSTVRPREPAGLDRARRAGPAVVDGGRLPPGRRRVSLLLLVAAAAGIAAAGALAGILAATGVLPGSERVTTVVAQQAPASVAGGGAAPRAAAVYAAAAPGVVSITARSVTSMQTPFGLEPQTAVQSGAGSVLDLKGHILTAEHVVEGASSLSVEFEDGTVRSAKLLGRDSAIDAAVLRIDPSGLTLHPLTLGTLASVKVGDSVFAIGDPFGYPRSLSAGLVSGLDRTIEAPNGFTVAHAIQTDAAFNPGNSGGPLLDARGRVIGVVDQIATGDSPAGTNTGVGFAVPVDVVKAVLPQLERGATPAHAYLGVAAADATPSGALVQQVTSGSPADEAGVEAGDVVVALGTSKVTGVSDLVAATAAHQPGDHLTVTVERNGERLALPLVLGKQPLQQTG
jgi:S1-C subfamily serine protease